MTGTDTMRVMPSVAPHETNSYLRYDLTTPNTGNLENLLCLAQAKPMRSCQRSTMNIVSSRYEMSQLLQVPFTVNLTL
jgi:hypothetical protein